MKGFVSHVKGFGHSPDGKEYTLHIFNKGGDTIKVELQKH